jgi:hypothetical protein
MVLALAKEALDIQVKFKQFTDDDHPLGQRLAAMTPPLTLLFLVHLTKDCGVLTSTEAEPSIQDLPIPPLNRTRIPGPAPRTY